MNIANEGAQTGVSEITSESLESPLLDVRNLRVYFQDGWGWNPRVVRAVDGVDLTLRAGETLGIVGESGCGKSTTLRAILRLVPIHSGAISWKGVRIEGHSERSMRPLRQQMQMIFQDPFSSLNPRMTVRQIVSEPLHIFRRYSSHEVTLRAMAVLDRVGMNPRLMNRYPHEFSGGQRQRIGIARALVLRPELVLCDEPVSALDVSIQAQIINLLKDLQDDLGLSYLFISHDLAVVRHMADRIGVMYKGRIVEHATAHDLYRTPRHPYTRSLLASMPVPDPQARPITAPSLPIVENEVTEKGCAFAPRCPWVEPGCREATPPLLGGAHQVACLVAQRETLPTSQM